MNKLERIKYYLLDFKDQHMDWYYKNFDTNVGNLSDDEFLKFFIMAVTHDMDYMSGDRTPLPKDERDEIIDEIIDKVESMKGLAGKMSMGEWSPKMIKMLENFKEEK